MKLFNLLYKDFELFQEELNNLELEQNKKYYISIHSVGLNQSASVQLAKRIKELFPNSLVAGVPTTAILYNGEIYNNEVLVSIMELEHGTFDTKIFSSIDKNSQDIVLDIKEFITKFPSNFGVLLFDMTHSNISEITQSINQELPNISFAGGIVGTHIDSNESSSFVFDETGCYQNAYIVTLFSKEFVLSYTNTVIGQPSISETFTITKAVDNKLEEIDNVPAIQWLNKHLGHKEIIENKEWQNGMQTDILLKYPIILDDCNCSTRFLKYDKDNTTLKPYIGKIKSDQKFSIGYLSPIKSIEEWQEICFDLQITSAQMIFCYSCEFKHSFLHDITKWEMKAFKHINMCGAFLSGEIGTKDGLVQFLNGGSSVFTLAEKENYLRPDFNAFLLDSSIVESSDKMIKEIESLTTKSKKENSIFVSLIEEEKALKKRVFYSQQNDEEFGTIIDFLKRQTKNPQKQICLVTIRPQVERNCQQCATSKRNEIFEYINTQFSDLKFMFYNFDETNFIFTIENTLEDRDFIDIVKNIYNYFEINNCICKDLICRSSFTFTLKGYSIQKLLNVAYTQTLTQNKRFNLCDDTNIDIDNLSKEFRMVSILKDICEHERVIPYFQTIYDNKKNSVYAYETLMRLKTAEGKIIFPVECMDIAKKYRLYLPLNICLIKNVFALFENRDEVISIKIASCDLESQEFQDTLFTNLKNAKKPQNFIFEFLDIGNYAQEDLQNFLYKFRKLGCKTIANDFSANQTNIINLGMFKFDMLKIDGSLTKLLGTDANYNNVLQSMVYMAKKLNIKLIASFVETASAHKQIIRHGVRYSQGYLFSKPIPFKKLEMISKENSLKAKQDRHNDKQSNLNNTNYMERKRKIVLFASSVFFVAMIGLAFSIFFNVQYDKFEQINSNLLKESTTDVSNDIELIVDNLKSDLQQIASAVKKNIGDKQKVYQDLEVMKNSSKFENIYISYDKELPLNEDRNMLEIATNTKCDIAKSEEILPIITINNQNQKLIVFSSCIYKDSKKIASLHGIYTLKGFLPILDSENYKTNGINYIVQFDEMPIDVNTKWTKLFSNVNNGEDLIDTQLDISSMIDENSEREDIKEALNKGESVEISYKTQGEYKVVGMTKIAGTNWFLIHIPTEKQNLDILKSIERNIFVFIAFIVIICIIYLGLNMYIKRLNHKLLIEALDNSEALSDRLQLSIETDSLTNIYSRASAIERIAERIVLNNKKNIVSALVILDIDNFKYINDTFGHNTGDLYLQDFTSAIKFAIHPSSILGRLGGDEFILFLDNVKDEKFVKEAMDKIFENIAQITKNNTSLAKVGVSAGIVMVKENKSSYDEIMIKADNALYAAKREGKNRYLFAGGGIS